MALASVRYLQWSLVRDFGLLICQLNVLFDLSCVLPGFDKFDAKHRSLLVVIGDYHVVDLDGICNLPTTGDSVVAGTRLAVRLHGVLTCSDSTARRCLPDRVSRR